MYYETFIRHRVLVALSVIVNFSSGPIVAAATDAAVDDRDKLMEIVVTAQRREEDLQAVPVAITVLSQQALQDNNVKTLEELQFLVPSMSAITGLTRDAMNISIRGQGLPGLGQQPGVVAYLNEVPIPTDHDGNISGGPGLLFDLENVQALKGPQGTLFGRNSVGGALLLQSARPTNEAGGHIEATYGNYNDREIDGAINMPISNTLLTRLAINGQVRDGYTWLQADPNHPDGIDADNRESWSARGTVTYRPNDVFQNDTIVSFSRFLDHGTPYLLTAVNPGSCPTSPVAQICLVPYLFPKVFPDLAQQQALGIRSAIPIDTPITSSGSNLSVNNISHVTLTDSLTFRNVLGYDDSNQVLALDADGTALPIFQLPSVPRDQTIRQITEEAQLLGKTLGGRLDWIGGAFFLDQPPTAGFVSQTGDIFGGTGTSGYRQGDKSRALFGQGTYDLSALLTNLKLIGGLRYTWDDLYSNTVSVLPVTVPCDPPACLVFNEHAKSSALTWTAGLDYQVASDTLLYLSSRRGYRAGGFNTSNTGAPLPGFAPEYVNNYEIGTKSDWAVASIPVRTNAAVYYEAYTDIQVQQSIFAGGSTTPSFPTENAAGARIWGVELEALAQVTRDLQLGATFDYLSFKYTKFDVGVNPSPLIATSQLNRVPRKYGLTAQYHLPLPAEVGDISVRAVAHWQAADDTDSSQPYGIIPAFGLLNMNADWNRIAGSAIDASLFVSNLTNKAYVVNDTDVYNKLGFVTETYGEPRMYGIRLRYRF